MCFLVPSWCHQCVLLAPSWCCQCVFWSPPGAVNVLNGPLLVLSMWVFFGPQSHREKGQSPPGAVNVYFWPPPGAINVFLWPPKPQRKGSVPFWCCQCVFLVPSWCCQCGVFFWSTPGAVNVGIFGPFLVPSMWGFFWSPKPQRKGSVRSWCCQCGFFFFFLPPKPQRIGACKKSDPMVKGYYQLLKKKFTEHKWQPS